MSHEVRIPSMGESVSEASVLSIDKKAGDPVVDGDTILVLETDKINMEIYADASGILEKLLVKEGDTVHTGDVIATISINADATKAAPSTNAAPGTNTDGAPDKMRLGSEQVDTRHSPAVSKMVKEQKLDLGGLVGTGKSGMITKSDVIGSPNVAVASKPAPATATSSSVDTSLSQKSSSVGRGDVRVKMSKLRQRVAERLKYSQNTAAMLTTFNEVDMSNLLSAREKYKEIFEVKHGVKLGFMSFFVRASVNALLAMPNVNASIDGSDIIYRDYCDVGVAISSDNGLVVPILRNAELMSFADIEKSIAEYGKKARSSSLSIDDMTGGTFTVSNGGVFGSLLSTPIINPPQTAILGMHKTQERPVVVNGAIVIRPMMYLALSYDHRLIDGKEAVTFLARIKQHIEDPLRLLLDL